MSRAIRESLIAMLVVFVPGCATRAVSVGEHGNPASHSRVLVATRHSDFKDVVVAKVTEELGEQGCFVKTIDLRDLPEEAPETYDAIVVVGGAYAWRLQEPVRTFLEKASPEDLKKTVLLTTGLDPQRAPRPEGVNAVTSASKPERAEEVAGEIVKKVRERLAAVAPAR